MSKKLLALAVTTLALCVLGFTVWTGAQAADVKADYDRANSLNQRVNNKVYDTIANSGAMNWIAGSQKFWYEKSVKGGNSFVLVDPAAASKAPAFDHTRLAAAISTASSGTYTALTLPISTFTYVDNMAAIEFALAPGGRGGAGRAGGAAAGRGGAPAPGQPAPPRYRCTLSDYQCTKLPDAAQADAAAQAAQAGRAGGQGRGGGARGCAPDPSAANAAGRAAGAAAGGGAGGRAGGNATPAAAVCRSFDGKSEAFIENYNIFVRPLQGGGRAPEATQLSWDGSEGNAYTFGSVAWSPDSKKIAAFKLREGYHRLVTYVQSSPSDQLQPKTSTMYYQKPGDVVDLNQPVLFDVESKHQTIVDNSLFPNPYNNRAMQWRRDSHAFTFEYNQRGHQAYRVIEVDAATGKSRAIIDETSKTFIDYSVPTTTLSGSGHLWRNDLADGKEILWMSERDGWSHLYLYDGVTGQVKNQVTKGNWAVHSVDRVDETNRQVYFWANGMDAGKDPYFLQYFRINFDGTGLTRYTTADAMHQTVVFSPDRQYYVDTYSRVDLAAVSDLRKASDQSLVMTLEKGDITDLLATGWRTPEVFTAKGRDGATDIWGIIIRPTNFDPSRKYPVIENIYAGPQGSFVPKTFSTQGGMQTIAELGFVVVQVDGMGTANRSRAFHDTSFKNLGDAGFPDRILWHKAIAAKYPWYDITRVGIYGTSAGGQNAMGAVVFHPEFYKASVASAGCHDNRMDKIWWNEQWMGWPIGPEYKASSNMENAAKLGGALMLIVGEMDNNVDPSSTMQVVNRLILANKNFDLLVIPNALHTNGGAYGDHKRFDFFMHHLRGLEPPVWSAAAPPNAGPGGIPMFDGVSVFEVDALPWVASENQRQDQ
jgi:dipeptidyl aminopeptidase/acylaminoacyl peptidase